MQNASCVQARRLVVLLFGAAWLLGTPVAAPALMAPKSVEQMASEAHAIVEGHVAEVESVWSADHTQIYTWVTIDIRKEHKGAGMGSVLKLRLFGGELDGVGMAAEDSPTLVKGSDVVLFLGPNPQAFFPTVGMAQGVFTLSRDEATGRDTAVNIRGVTLEKTELESQIQRALARPGETR